MVDGHVLQQTVIVAMITNCAIVDLIHMKQVSCWTFSRKKLLERSFNFMLSWILHNSVIVLLASTTLNSKYRKPRTASLASYIYIPLEIDRKYARKGHSATTLLILIFSLWTFRLYVKSFQEHLHFEIMDLGADCGFCHDSLDIGVLSSLFGWIHAVEFVVF